MKPANTIYAGLGTTIFETMSRLADQHKAINLGQGFPDEGGPASVVETAADHLKTGSNQYPPMAGLPALRQAIARHEERHWGLARDWASEVVVTSGATEALAAAIFALVAPGDEVIVFEPLYDAYVPLIRRAGGVPVPIRLAPPDWRLNEERLRSAISPRTKAILINNPLNPAAKVFSRAELEVVARTVVAADAYVISDEVYEHLAFAPARHIAMPSLPGMNERTLKIGSAGKVFSMTGWKVGWITGPASLVQMAMRAHQFLTFTTPPNLQAGVAAGLDQEDRWLSSLGDVMRGKRDELKAGLEAAGLKTLDAQGTYFLCVSLADTSWAGRDNEYCRWITEHAGVTAIPLSAFYVGEPERSVVRFCFAKRSEVLCGASERLARVRNAR